jgi:hypothetical protein
LRALDRHARTKLARFQRRARLLRTGHDDAGRMLDLHQLETELGGLVINLQTYWSNWCRAFYLSGALGTVSASGAALSSVLGLTSEHDALTVAITGSLSPSRPPPPDWPSNKEPFWHSPATLTQVVSKARFSSAATLGTYLASAPSGLEHLRTVRNYYAHRCEPLRRAALALGPTYLVGSAKKPSDILLFVEPGRSVTVLERWILDIGRLHLHCARDLAHSGDRTP